MIVTSAKDANFLPLGNLFLVKDGTEFEINVDDAYCTAAAQCIINNGSIKEFQSQAEVIVEAINVYKWDIGSLNNYSAFSLKNTAIGECSIKSFEPTRVGRLHRRMIFSPGS